MTKEKAVLYTSNPIRDRGWWARTAIYWVALLGQDPQGFNDPKRLLIWLAIVVTCGVAVFFRDRHPWVIVVLGTVLSATIAQTPITLGVVVVASRAHRLAAIAYAALAVGITLLPWERLISSGITISGSESRGDWSDQLAFLVLMIALPLLVGMQRRTSRLAEQQRLAFEADQRELAAREAVVDERNRIAQEMHDVLGHKLSLITVQAGALEVTAADAAPKLAEQAELLRATSKAALDDLRTILGVLGEGEGDALHPQPGLAEALALIEHNQVSGMRITLVNELPATLALPNPVAAAIHRVIQEGLTNAHRHAPGAAVTVALTRPDADNLAIELVNRPSAQPSLGGGTGRGLPGLGERVRSLQGTIDAGETAEGGYRLHVTLPVPHQGGSDE